LFIKIFETSVEYICCGIISGGDTAIAIVVKLSDTRDYCQVKQWYYCFNCRYETSSANWNTFERNAAGTGPL